MRNLKKVLSLVLCVAMMLSVMVVGAGAAFSDQSKIKNTEAVDACTALNIIGGYPDGSFKPEGNITRAEVTKMICVALNGGKNPAVSTNTTPTFSDVRNNANAAWAEGYIESCAAQGIVSGVGGGKFAPNGNVTGVQLAKMLLVSLGYKSENEGFTGNAWATNVNVRATQKGLYDGLDKKMDTNAALTRDNAAQMIWNALQAYEVEYKTTLVTDSKGQLTSQITVQDKVVGSTNDKITLLRDKYDAWMNVGTLVSVDGKDLTITMSNSDRAGSDTKDTDFTKLATDYSSLLGQKVKVIFKNGKANDVLGVYATGDNTVYKALLNDVEKDGSKVKFDGKSYSVDNTNKINTIFVGIDGTTTSDKALSYFDSTANSNAGKTSLNEVTFVDTDDNGKIDTAIVIEKVAAKVTSVSSDKIVFNGKTYKYADEQIDKDIKTDDYAIMSVDLYKDCKNIEKATVVTATVDGYKDKTNYHQYKMDGTWYNLTTDVKNDAGVSTGDTATAYVCNNVIVNLDSDDGNGSFPNNIAVAVGVGSDSSLTGDQVRVRYFDGTLKTLTLSDKSVNPVQGVAYKISGPDSDAKLETLTANHKYNGYTATTVTGTVDADPSSDKIGTVKVDDKAAVILYSTNGRSKLITGKQFNALVTPTTKDQATVVFTKESNGLNRVQMAAVKVSNINISGKSSDNYGYIVSTAYEKDGDLYYTIWNGTKNVDVIEEGNYSSDDRSQGTLIGYSNIDTNNKINDVTDYGNIGDTVKTTSSTAGDVVSVPATGTAMNTTVSYIGGNQSTDTKYISVNNRQFKITADTTVLFVDSDADKDEDIGQAYTYGTTSMVKAQKDASDNYTYNVFFVMDEAVAANADNKEIAVLVIDATGAFKGYKMDDVNAPSVSVATSGTPVYGTASVVTINPTYKNFTAVKTEITAPGLNVASSDKVSTSATTDAGTYTVTVKGTDKDGKTVSTTAKVVVAKKAVTPAALTAPSAPIAGSRFNAFKPTFNVAPDAGYTLGTPVVTIDGTDIATAPLSTFATGDVLTITVPVTADKNHTVTVDKLTTTVTVAQP